MSAVDPICVSESEDIAWFPRSTVSRAQARHWGEEEFSRFDLVVRQGHVRELVAEDCPVHPDGECGDWGSEDEGCRCYEIEEGWWEDCTHRDRGAVAAWRVEPKSPTPTGVGG